MKDKRLDWPWYATKGPEEVQRITSNNIHYDPDNLLKKIQRYLPQLSLKEAKFVKTQFLTNKEATNLLELCRIQSIRFSDEYEPIDTFHKVNVVQFSIVVTRSFLLFFKIKKKVHVSILYKY